MGDVIDLNLNRLVSSLEELAWLCNIDETLLKTIVADSYLRGWQDRENNKMECKNRIQSLKDSLKED